MCTHVRTGVRLATRLANTSNERSTKAVEVGNNPNSVLDTFGVNYRFNWQIQLCFLWPCKHRYVGGNL